jgi:dynein heavy chain
MSEASLAPSATAIGTGEGNTLDNVPASRQSLESLQPLRPATGQGNARSATPLELNKKALLLFKRSVSLAGFQPELWTAEHDSVVLDFLSNDPDNRKLIGFVTQDSESKPLFCLHAGLPASPVKEIMYFIKLSSSQEEPISEENFEERIQFGTISGDAMDSLLRLMQGVYLPLFLTNKHWPESIRKEFNSQLHRFMALLTDTTSQLKRRTVLYVPDEDLSNLEKAAKTKDLVQRLESLLVHWTRQIKEVINSQHTSESTENSGPLDEIEFWRSRCDDLSGLSEQLNRDEVKKITKVLELAKSSYLDQFQRLSNLIQEGTMQAQDNLRFLSSLTESCQALAEAEPQQIPGILPKLLMYVRLIWANSKYYNTKERMTSLLRKISNEIIRRCCAKISLEDIFHKDVQASMVVLQESIQCGEAWKAIYKKTCQHVLTFTKQTWDFDTSSIFAQVDAFVQRCRDLIEVCEGQIQFARKLDAGKKEPLPVFGGSRGAEIAKGYVCMKG